MKRIDFEDAADQLHELIRKTFLDSDLLAALYENAFDAVESCIVDDGDDCLVVEYVSGLEP